MKITIQYKKFVFSFDLPDEMFEKVLNFLKIQKGDKDETENHNKKKTDKHSEDIQ